MAACFNYTLLTSCYLADQLWLLIHMQEEEEEGFFVVIWLQMDYV